MVSSSLFTADEVAAVLNLHVKTVRRYIRDGRLKARRIGKEYRITRADLDEFAGETPTDQPVPRTRHVIASTIVDVYVVSPEENYRITTMIMAALNSRKGEADSPRVDVIYYEEQAKLRITMTTNPLLTCELLRMITTLLDSSRRSSSSETGVKSEDGHGGHL
jgi:excisionase family DNA binding protein